MRDIVSACGARGVGLPMGVGPRAESTVRVMEQLTHSFPPGIDPVDLRERRRQRGLYEVAGELVLVFGLWLGYRQVRHATRDQADEAFSNAQQVIDFERHLNLFNERAVQSLVLHSDAIVWLLNQYYARVHLPLTAVFVVWLLFRHPGWYRTTRTWLITVTLAGLLIHVTYPLAPPRMMRGLGFVDTLRERGLNLYSADPTNSFANQFAAMPSLHFGWAVIVACVFVSVKRTRTSALVVAHPVITLLAIVATANHYWIDAIIALMLVVGAYLLTVVILRHSRISPPVARSDQPTHPGLTRELHADCR